MIRPSFRLPVDGTAVLTAVRRRDGMLGRPVAQGRDGTVVRPSVRPTGLDGHTPLSSNRTPSHTGPHHNLDDIEYIAFNLSLTTTLTNMKTPPTSPQRQQYRRRARQTSRERQLSQDTGPHRRRVPNSRRPEARRERALATDDDSNALLNGLLTPPATHPHRDSSRGNGQRGETENNEQTVRRPAGPRLMAARSEYHDPEARHDLGPMNVKCLHCGALHWVDKRVAGSSKHNPEFGICCDHSKVKLQRFEQPPEPLLRLFFGNGAQAQEFRSHITQYNSTLAFTSLGVSDDKRYQQTSPECVGIPDLGESAPSLQRSDNSRWRPSIVSTVSLTK
ncbi:hypothetical protein B0H19DRAFT_1275024 [Mycena capillaripes]|nr:hypothetical protein B0H19DRAFT_1275024 [Mycena capillaripes]